MYMLYGYAIRLPTLLPADTAKSRPKYFSFSAQHEPPPNVHAYKHEDAQVTDIIFLTYVCASGTATYRLSRFVSSLQLEVAQFA